MRSAAAISGLLLRVITCCPFSAALAAEKAKSTPPAVAHSQREIDFDLPAQSAANALLAFSKQTNIEVLFSFNALRNATSQKVTGRFEPEEALKKLLKGTGFVAQPHGAEKFVVAPLTRKTGAIKGRFLDPEGRGIRAARIILPTTRQATTTNSSGEFAFSSVEAGTHALVVNAESFESLQLANLEVDSDRVLVLAPRTLHPVDDPARLAPYVVKDSTTRRDPFDRSEALSTPRIAGSNLDLARTENDALPFNIYNRDQIARSGVVNLNEFLQRELLDTDPAAHPPDQDGTQPTFLAGSTNLDLRGFGSDQTIILVNGRRLPETLINGSIRQTPDVNFIPLSLVQQVEVLPVSAAALYSGNAVGGIINIVLRPGVDAEATEVALTYTNALGRYDAPQSSASFLHSRSLLGGALRLRFNASITQSKPPTETELQYRQRHDTTELPQYASLYRATPNIRSLAIAPPNPTEVDPPPPALPPPPLFGPGTATVTSVAPGADGNGGLAAFNGQRGVRNFTFFDSPGGLASSLDSFDYPYGREQRRTAYFGSVVYDVVPWLQLSFDGTYTHSVMHRGYDVIAADLRLRSESPYNPFGQEATVSLNEMAPALGENYSEARLEFASAVLSALFKLPRDWRVLLDAQYGRNIAKYRGLAGADYSRWQAMVDEGRYNPLRDTQVFGPPREYYDRVLIYRGGPDRFVTLGDYSTLDAALRFTNHALKIPTGTAAVNFGADYRRNELAPHKDERTFADGELAIDTVVYGGRTLGRYSIFGEVQAPLLPSAWLPRAIKSIETDVAVRYIASNQSKESNVAPTFALKAQLPAGFTFRGSVSTSSRFPTPQMSRLATSGAVSGRIVGVDLKPAYDPVQKEKYNVQQDEFLDPDLQPEDALTQTAGIVFRRGRVHRFRASLDYVDTHKVNELIALDVQTILNLERLFPDRVIRKTEAGPDGRVGTVATVITGTINSAWRRSDNWNASLDYAWTGCFGGTFEAYGRLLYFTRYDHLLLPGTNVVNELSHPEGGSSNLLRYRAKFGTAWSNDRFGFGVDGHYFHSRVLPVVEWSNQGSDRIEPFWQFDAFLQGNIGHWLRWVPRGVRAQLRVNNVLSSSYPRYPTSGTGAGVQTYGDWRGRVYSLSLTTTF